MTKDGTSTVLTDAFTFRAPTAAATTSQIAAMKTTAAGYNKTYSYTYDGNGNILSISDGSSTTTYVYDTANQLIRENNQAAGKTWTWTYDNGGNITSRREYAYTTGTLGAVKDTVNYSYGDSAWGDLLTGYDGKAVTSDAIGNVLSDGVWTYTWEHGRQLASMSRSNEDEEVTIDYAYNTDGLRTEKTVTTKTYAPAWHTVTFEADGVTVKTMTVENGYVLKDTDYPAVPAKTGHTGTWTKYKQAVTQDITINAVYWLSHCTVTFEADDRIVSTKSVEYGYVLQEDDYPAVPFKSHYKGSWEKFTNPITSDITIKAVYSYVENPEYHTVTFKVSGLASNSVPEIDIPQIYNPGNPGIPGGFTHQITVEDGYILQVSDYPTGKSTPGYRLVWDYNSKPITSDTTVLGYYKSTGSERPIDPPKPPVETISIPSEGAQSVAGQTGTSGMVLASTVTEKHSYVYTGDKLTQETITTTTTENGKTTTATETLYYAYDANGLPMSLEHTNSSGAKTTYYYAANIQGDVTAILDANGKAVVEYTYDAWGNPLTTSGSLASTVGKANSLRYRGYVYDTETEFYYLQSRYYNPGMGRFINADIYASTGQGLLGNNMFAYSGNNPVLYFDPDGNRYVIRDDIGGGHAGKSLGQKIREMAKSVGQFTWTNGWNLAACFGPCISSSVGTALDTDGNFGIVFTFCFGSGFPGASVGDYFTLSAAPQITDLEGLGFQAGGTLTPCPPVYLGGEYAMAIDVEQGTSYSGATILCGAGLSPAPVELHGEIGYTKVIKLWNVFDVLDSVIGWITG